MGVYPQSSSTLVGFSITNHPAIGDPSIYGNPLGHRGSPGPTARLRLQAQVEVHETAAPRQRWRFLGAGNGLVLEVFTQKEA